MGLLTSIRRPLLAPQSSLRRGLVAYYTFDEQAGTTVLDRSGNGNTGTVNGTLAGFWTPNGVLGGAGTFNGTNNYVQVADTSQALAFVGNLPFSCSLWLYATTTFSTFPRLISHEASTNQNWLISVGPSSMFLVRGNASAGDAVTMPIYTLSTWNHLVMTYDGINIRGYLNNSAPVVTASSRAIPASSTGLFLGATNALGGFWTGREDEIALYNRALTANDVATLFAKGQGSRFL